ncbi:MAG: cation diffusion facilitator family transporter [Rhodospirillales bacterium]
MQDTPLHIDDQHHANAKLMVAATYASVSVAAILICAKLGAWLFTDSVSLLSSLVDSLLDAAASLVNLFAVRSALQPADREHRFGHGKAESLAGLGQAAFIAGSGVFLLLESVERLITPSAVDHGLIGIAVMAFSILLTLVLVGFQIYVVKRTNSIAISADSLHYRIDILVNLAVIVSLFLASILGWKLADPLFAILIIAYMGFGAYKILRRSLNDLMDTEFPEADRARIREIVLAHPDVLDIHDMRTRSSGPDAFIQLHIEMDRDLTLVAAHEISDQVMYSVEQAFPNAQVLIHQDPEGIEERRDQV